MAQENNGKYTFSYSAPTENERRMIQNIRNQYEPKTEIQSKLEQLKALDNKVKTPPKAAAIAIGTIGILIFGAGMSLVLAYHAVVLGAVVSVIGAILIGAAYPVFKRILKVTKRKYGGIILSLSEELLNEKNEEGKQAKQA